MRTPINLASEPFRRDRPIFVGALAMGTLLTLTLALLVYLAIQERGQVAESRVAVQRLQTQLQQMDREEARLQGVLRRPGNAEVLERSQFMNGLILPKSVSWTRLFTDLETVVPSTVRLVTVRPQVSAPGGVTLEMTVAATSGEPVGELLTRLQNSPLFGATFVSSILPPTEADPQYRYRLSVSYAQKL